jgi:hypothetical protein
MPVMKGTSAPPQPKVRHISPAKAAVSCPWFGESRLRTRTAVINTVTIPAKIAFWGRFRLIPDFLLRLAVLRVPEEGLLLLLRELVPPRVVLLRALACWLPFLLEEVVEVVFLFAIAQMFLWHYNMEPGIRQVVW